MWHIKKQSDNIRVKWHIVYVVFLFLFFAVYDRKENYIFGMKNAILYLQLFQE